MKNQIHIHYDEEGDYFELQVGDYTNGYFENTGEGIFYRIDDTTKSITGLAIQGLRAKTKNMKELKIVLPTHLNKIVK